MANDTIDTTINQFFYDGNVCPNCKKGFKLSYSGSQYYGCPHCMSYLDISTKGKFKKITASSKKFEPSLPLGSKGEIGGVAYEVIGYTHCREHRSIYTWNEYYLYNRSQGFAYLSECDGHWIFLTAPALTPKIDFKSKDLVHEERQYRLYNSYRCEVRYSEGEFDYDILRAEKPGIYEYIHPPYMLSCERNGQTADNWLQGEHIEGSEIKKIFSLSSLPRRSGVGMVQPFSKGYSLSTLWKVTIIGLLALLLVHVGITSLKPSYKVVFDQSYTPALDSNGAIVPVVSAPFVLGKGILETDNLEISLYAPVSNSWIETQLSLINDQTGEEYNVSIGVEYYSGIDWTEGSHYKSITLSEIPAGTYHLNIFPVQENTSSASYYTLTLTRGVEMWSNLFIIIACILVFPAFQSYRYNSIEKERWSNSNYA